MGSKIQESDTNCFYPLVRSKWSDATLITGGVVLGVLGGLTTLGILSFLSHTQAAYLSYGLYGGSGALFVAECLKRVIQCCIRPSEQKKDLNTEEPSDMHLHLKERLDGTKDAEFIGLTAEYREMTKVLIGEMIDSSDFKSDPASYIKRVRHAVSGADQGFFEEMKSILEQEVFLAQKVMQNLNYNDFQAILKNAYLWLQKNYPDA